MNTEKPEPPEITLDEFLRLGKELEGCYYISNASYDREEIARANTRALEIEKIISASPFEYDGDGNPIDTRTPIPSPEHNPDGLPEMEEFRFLRIGEPVISGDQIWMAKAKQWLASVAYGVIVHCGSPTYRRRVTPIPATGGEKGEQFQKGGDEPCPSTAQPAEASIKSERLVTGCSAPTDVQAGSQGPDFGITRAPWTPEQVELLNNFQTQSGFHPFTCGSGKCNHVSLIAHEDGWRCPNCDYRQYWAHNMMTRPFVNPFTAPPAAPDAQGEKDAEIARLKAERKEGRRESLAILFLESAEDFADDFQVSSPLGDTGDFVIGWDVDKLKELFDVDSESSLIDRLDAGYYSMMSERDEAQHDLATVRAESAAKDGIIEGLVEALEANRVFHTPIALRRKPGCQWDDFEIDAIDRTKTALARAEEAEKTGGQP